MEIVVKGRNVEVPDHFRVHVAEKLERSERYDPKIIRVDVELSHETNRRQRKTCQRVQITLSRAAARPCARRPAPDSFYAALDAAVTKLETRLRRSAERRIDRRHERTPIAAVAVSSAETARRVEQRRRRSVRRRAVGATGLEPTRSWRRRRTIDSRRRRTRPNRPDQGPSRGTDHGRPGVVPDGARRTRLLPVQRRGHAPRVGRLPAQGLRLRAAAAHLTRVRPATPGRYGREPTRGPGRTVRLPWSRPEPLGDSCTPGRPAPPRRAPRRARSTEGELVVLGRLLRMGEAKTLKRLRAIADHINAIERRLSSTCPTPSCAR